MVHACKLSYMVGVARKFVVQDKSRQKNVRLYLKNNSSRKDLNCGSGGRCVRYLSSKCEALSSNPSTTLWIQFLSFHTLLPETSKKTRRTLHKNQDLISGQSSVTGASRLHFQEEM
jgi:hypothetical protein